MTKIVLISDLHYGSVIGPNKLALTFKTDVIARMINYVRDNKDTISCVIAAGDLTDHGYNGQTTGKAVSNFFSCCGTNNSIIGGSEINELQSMITSYMTPIDNIIGIPKHLLIHGNHDEYNGASKTYVQDFIKSRYGSLYYEVKINDITILMCSKYATHEICNWLKIRLEVIKQTGGKCLIVQHYNLSGEFSPDIDDKWWTKVERQHFYETIDPYLNNILGICVGHKHVTGTFVTNTINGHQVLEIYGAGTNSSNNFNQILNGININFVNTTYFHSDNNFCVIEWDDAVKTLNISLA